MVPLHLWEWALGPWQRIHIDYAGPFRGKMFLVVVDAHSQWVEIVIVLSVSSFHTISKLRSMFATFSLPKLLISNNGTAFASSDCQEFMRRNGIRHVTSTPYHPSTNGWAERYVQMFKAALQKSGGEDVQRKSSCFLFHYRTTPHSTTGTAPRTTPHSTTGTAAAELMMG